MKGKKKNKYLAETNEFSFVLAPSKIEGVGVFATHPILKGVKLRIFPEGKSRFYSRNRENKLSPLKRWFFYRYCVESKNSFECPPDFGRLAIVWFMNHSNKSNTSNNEKSEYFAKHNIEEGEEITTDYKKLPLSKIPNKVELKDIFNFLKDFKKENKP